MLHQQADGGNSRPAAGAEKDWLSAAFDQFHHVAVQTDGSHGHDDKEFGQLFQRCKHVCADAGMYADGGEHGGENKVQNKHRECAAETEISGAGRGFFFLCRDGSQNQCDRNDGQCSGQFYGDGLIQCRVAEVPHAVPGSSGCGYR